MKNKVAWAPIRRIEVFVLVCVLMLVFALLGKILFFAETFVEAEQVSSELGLVELKLYDNIKESIEAANVQTEKEISESFIRLKIQDGQEVKVLAYVLDLSWFEIETKNIGNNEYTFIPMSLMSMYDEPRVVVYEIEVGSNNHTETKYFAFEGKMS